MNPPDPSPFIKIIQQAYPQLIVERARLNQEGQYNDVLFVNEEWIFRFAKFAEGIDALKREVAILERIHAHLTLATPQPLFQHLAPATVGESFIGYRLIPGQPLWLEEFHALDPTAQVHMAHQLADFLRQLHSIPVAQFADIHLPLADQIEEWSDLYHRIQQTLLPKMRADARAQVVEHFESYFANPHDYHFTPVLRHGDFGTGNLLYDLATRTITGVIDFGAATLGDPAIDFAGLFSFGEDFCRHCYAVYPELESMLPRVRFYRGTFALQEALYGAETGDREAYASGMEGYV